MRTLIFVIGFMIVGAIDKQYQEHMLEKTTTMIIVGLCVIFDAIYTYKKLRDL